MDLRGEPGGDSPRDAHIRRTRVPNSMRVDLGLPEMIKLSLGMTTADRIHGPIAAFSIAIPAVIAIGAGVAFGFVSLSAGGGYLATILVTCGTFAAVLGSATWFIQRQTDRARPETRSSAGRAPQRATRPAVRKHRTRRRVTTKTAATKKKSRRAGPQPPDRAG